MAKTAPPAIALTKYPAAIRDNPDDCRLRPSLAACLSFEFKNYIFVLSCVCARTPLSPPLSIHFILPKAFPAVPFHLRRITVRCNKNTLAKAPTSSIACVTEGSFAAAVHQGPQLHMQRNNDRGLGFRVWGLGFMVFNVIK